VNGKKQPGVYAKDIVLAIIQKFGVNFGTGSIVEFTGECIRDLSMEERMTICNMSIEAGAKAGLISPDDVTFSYIKGRQYAPKGEQFEKAVEAWAALATDEGATYDETLEIDADTIEPVVTWGTNPAMSSYVSKQVPTLEECKTEAERKSLSRALEYMGLQPGMAIEEIPVQHVFIGSCTNARLSDLRDVAAFIKGKKVSPDVRAIIVPGSQNAIYFLNNALHIIF